jgi:hypothetical protein
MCRHINTQARIRQATQAYTGPQKTGRELSLQASPFFPQIGLASMAFGYPCRLLGQALIPYADDQTPGGSALVKLTREALIITKSPTRKGYRVRLFARTIGSSLMTVL